MSKIPRRSTGTGVIKSCLGLVPILYRKRFKNWYSKTFEPKTIHTSIDQKSLSQLKNKASTKQLNIINFSVIAWNYRTQRPQHLAQEMSRLGHNVFYLHNEFLISNNKYNHPYQIKFIDNNIYGIQLSSTNNYFIYSELPSKSDCEYIKKSLTNFIADQRLTNVVLKIDHPFWYPIIKDIGYPTIYDCMDDHSYFLENSALVIAQEKELILNSDLVISTSHYLYQKAISSGAKKVELLPNAGDYSHFSQSSQLDKLSTAIMPVIGYFGAINYWMDIEFLQKIASAGYRIILIGKVENKAILKLAHSYKNVELLGEQSYNHLPDFLSQFDICLIPFQLNPLIKATNPVKIFEYFAQGKPVIASRIPELEQFKQFLYTYDKKTDINNLINQIQSEPPHLTKQRVEIARQNTWAKRALQFEKLITDFVILP